MDGVLLCAGPGSRMGSATEKPMVELQGRPMIDYVLDSLRESGLDEIYANYSDRCPRTRDHLRDKEWLNLVETPAIEDVPEGERSDYEFYSEERVGEYEFQSADYVEDLLGLLDEADQPTLVRHVDNPLHSGESIDRVVERYDGEFLVSAIPTGVAEAFRSDENFTQALGTEDGVEYTITEPMIYPDSDPESVLENFDRRFDVLSRDEGSAFTTWDARFAPNVNYPDEKETVARLL